MKRAIAAIAIAIPGAWIATGFADHSGWSTSGVAMCLIAPGLLFVFNVPLHLTLTTGGLNALAIAGLTALGISVVYYFVLCYGVLTIASSLNRPSGSGIAVSGSKRRNIHRQLA
jgi:hypothetical protein